MDETVRDKTVAAAHGDAEGAAGDVSQGGIARARAIANCRSSACRDGACDCEASVAGLLRGSGLRPTRQRLSLGALMFDGVDRHVTAEWLHEQARQAGVGVSLATVYNTLHQFVGAGLLREVAVEGSKSYFDTNTSDHHHFFLEGDGQLIDIAGSSIHVTGLPEIPHGHEVTHIDVVVRLRPVAPRKD
ncbi:MAG: transcriptional repressor [Rhodobiaceae bacterium]|nr:transcriptional repressor [Rhodobiaceae bacterium]MCC0017088.1 transcriptional repressor [Rhodobiaceae bacterium]